MPRKRFFTPLNINNDHSTITKSISKFLGLLGSHSINSATIVVSSIEYINNTVVPQVLAEQRLDALLRERETIVDKCTLRLCGQVQLNRGHSTAGAYLIFFLDGEFIQRVENLQAWSILVVATPENDANAWRNAYMDIEEF